MKLLKRHDKNCERVSSRISRKNETLDQDFDSIKIHQTRADPNQTATLNITINGTTLTLAVNTSAGAVPTIDGVAVNLLAGPYYRVSGNLVLGVTIPSASLTADFVFEPRDTDSNTANGYEEVSVGVANLAFVFGFGATTLLNVTVSPDCTPLADTV